MARVFPSFILVVASLLGTVASPPQSEHKPLANTDSPATRAPGFPASEKNAERYDALTLPTSGLESKPPLLLEKSSFNNYTRELWQVQWRTADPIDLYVIKPGGSKKPPVVLFLYSYPADTDRFRNDAYCRTVTEHGFAAVGFVSALTGQRYHDRPWKQWLISELRESLVTSVHDVQMILNYLDTRDDLDMSRVGMFGQGSGGTIAVLAGATDPRLKAVDVLDPWGDWEDWFRMSPMIDEPQRSQYLAPDFQQRIADLDPVKWLPQMKAGTVRIQETAFDPVTPKTVKEHIRAVLPAGAETVQYLTIDDYKRQAAQDGKILKWLNKQLAIPEN